MLNVLIIGVGAIAKAHTEAFLALKDRVKIVAVASNRMEKVGAFIESYGLDAKGYTDYKAALNENHIDVVSIITPPRSHKEIAVDCLKAGANVLLEKPMGTSLEECDAINNAAKESGKIVSVVAQSRFLSPIYNTKKLLDSGVCGKINYAQVNSYWFRGRSYYDLAWRGSWALEGGGVTFAQAIHHLDLLLWMKGKPTEVTAVMGNIAHDNSEEEDISTAVLKYADGSMAQVNCVLVCHGQKQELTFHTERAGIHIPFAVEASVPLENGFPVENTEFKELLMGQYEAMPTLKYEGHGGQIDNVITALETGTTPMVTGEDGRDAMELIMAIYKSASEKRTVTLPILSDDSFYTKEGMIAKVPHFYEKTGFLKEFAVNDISLVSTNVK